MLALLAGGPFHDVHAAPPLPPRGCALHSVQPGPAIAGPEHLGKVVHPVEVLDRVALLPTEQPDVDEQEHDATEIPRRGDAPVTEHGRGEQAELLEREVAARPGELGAGDVAARRELGLRVLQRGEHEQVPPLVVAAVALANLVERLLQGRQVAHAGASSDPPRLTRTAASGRGPRVSGASRASSSTSSIVSTSLMSSSLVTSSGTSTKSGRLRAGTSTVFTPARTAAVSFSFRPPIGSTRPRSVSSPVIANSGRAGRRHNSDASAVAMVIPADGPSLGTAPAGTCRCTSLWVNDSSGIPSPAARARSRLQAACADSFITS